MANIEVVNLTRQKIAANEINNSVKRIIQKLRRLNKFPFLKNIDLSIVFLEPEKIRELNKKYRKKDKPTDILSFTIERTKENLIGEIILCPAVIKTKNYLLPTTHYSLKLNHLIAHGMLHLCGYDHKTEKQWKNMEKISKLISYSLLAFAFVLFLASARVASAVGVIQCLPLKAVVSNDLEVKNDLTVNRQVSSYQLYVADKAGIGTNTPAHRLQVEALGDSNAMIKGTGSSGRAQVLLDSPGGVWQIENAASGTGNHPAGALGFTESGIGARVTFLKGGNVGIGTTSPAASLHIAGATPDPSIRITDSGEVGGPHLDITQGYNSYLNAVHGLFFDVNGDTSGDALSILSNGNVGIGTNLPNTELDVAGVITFSGNRVIDGGALTAYADTTEQYIVEVTPLSKGKVKLIDYATMSRLCRDIDGCEMTVARINYDITKPGQVATVNGILFMSEASDWWRWSQYGPPDAEARDNNGAVEEWKNVDCYVTDAETSINAFDGRTDSGLGFGLLNMVGAGSVSTTCRIIIED